MSIYFVLNRNGLFSGGFGFAMRPGMMGVPRFPGPGPWNMPYGGGNNGFGGGQNHNGYNHGGGNHNGFGNDHWNDFGGFGYPMEVRIFISYQFKLLF